MTAEEAAAFAAHLAGLGVSSLDIRWTPHDDGTGFMAVRGWAASAFDAELTAWRAAR